ncbi:MAG TPA: hypothetical protein PLP25_10710 [Candidatus Limiplasma sp.]|nr:hypothetical protein [Candidatus Limiplasma sp.]HPS82313.1 hypothetical protein [Candidatus Limiplasma sp.]
MNGFANAILSLLLGWLRSLFNAVWALFSSDHSGTLVNLLRGHWKLIFLVMCVGGFVVDRVIYFIRWRPDYVWRSRHRRRAYDSDDDYAQPDYQPAQNRASAYAPPYSRETDSSLQPYAEDAYADMPEYDEPQPQDFYAQTNRYQAPLRQPQFAPAAAMANQTPPAYAPAWPSPQSVAPAPVQGTPRRSAAYANGAFRSDAPAGFTPDASFAPTASYQALPGRLPLEPEPFADDPRFDDDPAYWNAPQAPLGAFSPSSGEQNIAAGITPEFGAPQAEPAQYLQDVQAGFAPQPAPEQLYAQHSDVAEPVHPGLDIETFHQNIGLTDTNALERVSRRDAAEDYPDFVPFTVAAQPDTAEAKARGLGALAKRARSFVSGEDERNPLSIRDLQPTVDMKNAFHAPVYPKKKTESEEE